MTFTGAIGAGWQIKWHCSISLSLWIKLHTSYSDINIYTDKTCPHRDRQTTILSKNKNDRNYKQKVSTTLLIMILDESKEARKRAYFICLRNTSTSLQKRYLTDPTDPTGLRGLWTACFLRGSSFGRNLGKHSNSRAIRRQICKAV